MPYATDAQRDLIRRLSGGSVEAAAQDYGFAPGRTLSVSDASQIIDYLKAPPAATTPVLSGALLEDIAKSRLASEAAAKDAEIARYAAQVADTARFDAILVERGGGHLTGERRREARRLIRRELEARG